MGDSVYIGCTSGADFTSRAGLHFGMPQFFHARDQTPPSGAGAASPRRGDGTARMEISAFLHTSPRGIVFTSRAGLNFGMPQSYHARDQRASANRKQNELPR